VVWVKNREKRQNFGIFKGPVAKIVTHELQIWQPFFGDVTNRGGATDRE
jgi:hypothetical protein